MDEQKFVTLREMDVLRDEVHRLDDHGSRGVGAIQVQLVDLVKDVVEMKVEMNTKFGLVDDRFEKQRMERIVGRRWLIGTSFIAISVLVTILGLLIGILQRVH